MYVKSVLTIAILVFLLSGCVPSSPASTPPAAAQQIPLETEPPEPTGAGEPEHEGHTGIVETTSPEHTAEPAATTQAPTREAPTSTAAQTGTETPTGEPTAAVTETAETGETSGLIEIPGGGAVDPQDLYLPDLITLPPFDLRFLIDDENDRKFIRFANAIANIGTGDVIMTGEMTGAETIEVTQHITTTAGTKVSSPVGEFIFHEIHNHWHWEGFSLYQVWSLKPNGDLDIPVGSSGKVSYCIRDYEPLIDLVEDYQPPEGIPTFPIYDQCDWELQGLSVGWSDTYIEELAGQAVDISHVSDGVYALVSTADPFNMILEQVETNNVAIVYFEISGRIMRNLGESLVPDD